MSINNREPNAVSHDPEPSLWDKPDVAKFFRRTPRTIELWMAAGYLPYFRIGRTVRFRRADILKRLEEVNRIGG